MCIVSPAFYCRLPLFLSLRFCRVQFFQRKYCFFLSVFLVRLSSLSPKSVCLLNFDAVHFSFSRDEQSYRIGIQTKRKLYNFVLLRILDVVCGCCCDVCMLIFIFGFRSFPDGNYIDLIAYR